MEAGGTRSPPRSVLSSDLGGLSHPLLEHSSPHSLSLSLLLRSCSLHLHLSLLLFLQQSVGPPLILSRAERSRVECMRARPASNRAEQHSPSATAPALARSLGASLAASCAHMHSVPLRSALLQARSLAGRADRRRGKGVQGEQSREAEVASASAGEGGGRAVTWKVEEGRGGGREGEREEWSCLFNSMRAARWAVSAAVAEGIFRSLGRAAAVGRPIEVRTPSYALIACIHVCVRTGPQRCVKHTRCEMLQHTLQDHQDG